MTDVIEFQRSERAKRDAEALAAAGAEQPRPLHGWCSTGNASTQVQLDRGRYELRFTPALERGSIRRHDPGYTDAFWAAREPPAPTNKIDLTRLGSAIAEHLPGRRDVDSLTEALGLEGRLALAERLDLVSEEGASIADANGQVILSGAGAFELAEPQLITVTFGALPASIEIYEAPK